MQWLSINVQSQALSCNTIFNKFVFYLANMLTKDSVRIRLKNGSLGHMYLLTLPALSRT